MYLFLMLASILGMLALIGILIIFAYNILRNKKNPLLWFSLAFIVFFLVIAVWQGIHFFNWA